MRITKVRDVLASCAAIVLVLVFVMGVMIATGKHVPYVSELLQKMGVLK